MKRTGWNLASGLLENGHDSEYIVRKKPAVAATCLDIWLMRRTAKYVRVGYSSTVYAMFLLCQDIRQMHHDELVQTLWGCRR
jgi:hypothetical protein